MKTWLITGCSTGVGRALAQAVLSQGDNVVATARDVSTLDEVIAGYRDSALALSLDVTDGHQIREVTRRAGEAFGGVDVLVNNAGYGYRAAVEEGERDAVDRLFATNFLGPVELIQAVLPSMRRRRSGTIVNISSIAARVSPAGSGFYAASKAALEAMTLSLRREVAPLGITAMAVEPGAFRTDFSGRSLTQSAAAIGDYAETAGRRRKENDTSDGHQAGDPAKAALALITAVEAPAPPAMLVLGPDALDSFRTALGELGADLDEWQEITRSTDYADHGSPASARNPGQPSKGA
jgi:NAD(P)-dependent dehydrogenase (short-subunit alcohol dehydrogenase family)